MSCKYLVLLLSVSLGVLSVLGSSCKRDRTRNEPPAGASASPARSAEAAPKAAPSLPPAVKPPAPAGSPAAGAPSAAPGTGTPSGSAAPGGTGAGSTTAASPPGTPSAGTTSKAASPTPPAVASPTPPAQPSSPGPASPGEKKAPAPAAVPPASGGQASTAKVVKENVVLTTSRGRVVIDLFEKDAPAHCENFKRLVRTGYLNGIPFHRVCYGFLQSGDPSGTGTGGLEESIPAEIRRPHLKGSLVAARKESNNPHHDSHGSQFFIMKIVHPEFNGKYTVFGQVIEGMEVVDQIPEGDREQDYQVPPGVAEKIIRAELVTQP